MFLRSMFVLFLSCLSVNTLGQSLTVSGTVTDEKGEPIIGASVLVIGTTNGSITNFDGIFTLNNVASNAQITISINEFADISLKYEEALLHLINRSIEELASYKNIQWVGKDRFFRFKPIGVPRERKITWKNKKTATRTVVAEIWNNEKKQILYFRQLSFRIQSFRSDEKWFISITPGWSFTYDGYSSCKQESQLIAQKKNLETNSAVYQHFMFISFCLSNKLEDNESEYKYISFSSPFDLKLNYTPQHGY